MSYRVKTVAAMTGIPRPTLLAWERRYDILSPRRSDSGYRIYDDADVALLRRLKGLVDAGHAISEAVTLARASAATSPLADGPAGAEAPLWERLLAALLRYDRDAVDRMGAELSRYAFAHAVDEVHLPLLFEVGEAWAEGRATIAQEHFVSAWCREQLLAIFHALGAGPPHGPKVVCATAPGELHELGLLAVSIKLALAGWRVTWLGADLPIDELIDAARAGRPRLVCLSVMTPQPPSAVRSQARQLRDAVDPSALVVVGGRAVAGLEPESTDELLFAPTFASLQARLVQGSG